jgi:hypothetical protein
MAGSGLVRTGGCGRPDVSKVESQESNKSICDFVTYHGSRHEKSVANDVEIESSCCSLCLNPRVVLTNTIPLIVTYFFTVVSIA